MVLASGVRLHGADIEVATGSEHGAPSSYAGPVTPVLETMALGSRWPTVDPFLFVAHHDDLYPAGTVHLGPARELLADRPLGSDFGGRDGWSMYHGQVVPGFPQHPHRGFETITFVRQGLIDHADSLGATARFGEGDVQWTTAGEGIVHSEMFPLLHADRPNPVELFQIWINLPESNKLVAPHFSMFWDQEIPRYTSGGSGRPRTEVTMIAGPLAGGVPLSAPPHSWASNPDADVTIWHVDMEPGATWDLPPSAHPESIRTLYLFAGGPLDIAGIELAGGMGATLAATRDSLTLTAGPAGAVWMLLGGRPIGEPVAQYGPFVMNDRAGIEQALADYQRTGFGGWPWPSDDPNHGPAAGRFARHADGRVEQVSG